MNFSFYYYKISALKSSSTSISNFLCIILANFVLMFLSCVMLENLVLWIIMQF